MKEETLRDMEGTEEGYELVLSSFCLVLIERDLLFLELIKGFCVLFSRYEI